MKAPLSRRSVVRKEIKHVVKQFVREEYVKVMVKNLTTSATTQQVRLLMFRLGLLVEQQIANGNHLTKATNQLIKKLFS